MVSRMKIEYYPLWMKENPDLFEKSKVDFLNKVKEEGLSNLKEYWQCGLFYMEASL